MTLHSSLGFYLSKAAMWSGKTHYLGSHKVPLPTGNTWTDEQSSLAVPSRLQSFLLQSLMEEEISHHYSNHAAKFQHHWRAEIICYGSCIGHNTQNKSDSRRFLPSSPDKIKQQKTWSLPVKYRAKEMKRWYLLRIRRGSSLWTKVKK